MPTSLSHPPASFHLLALLLVVVNPLVGYFYERPYLRRISTEKQKVVYYRYLVTVPWLAAAAGLWLLGPDSLFFSPASPGYALPVYAKALCGFLLAAFFTLALLPFFQSLRGEKYRSAYGRAIRRSLDQVAKLLPETHAERLWFVAVSISAGVCEEALCRGFLFRYLHGIGFNLPLTAILFVTAAVFGVNHAYQGAAGALKTGIAGFAFGGLFLLTGNLALPMVLHAAIDLQAVFILWPAAVKPVTA